MTESMPLTEQRIYDAADSAYLFEGGYLAPASNDLARSARDNVLAGCRRGNVLLPRKGPSPDEHALMHRFGIVYSGGAYHYALQSYEHFYDALVRAWATAKRPH